MVGKEKEGGTKMKFKTQVCTTKGQSERLLALGLKKETADMWLTDCFVGYNGTPMIFVGNTLNPSTVTYSKRDIPAWSLHRLIAIYCDGMISSQLELVGLTFDRMIDLLASSIKSCKLNKEYLEDRP